MRIGKCFGTTKEEIESKKFNISIGISLGNKFFIKENIRKYILWALENTKEDVLVIIPDRIHAINIREFDNKGKLGAYRKAMKLANEKEIEIEEIISSLNKEKRSLIKVARWKEVTGSKYYDYRLEILTEEFNKKEEFYKFIINIVQDNYKNSPHGLNQERLEKLSQYILQELPVFVNAIYYGVYRAKTSRKAKKYDFMPYPGLNKFDELIIGLQNGKLFPELGKKLYLNEKMYLGELFID